MKQLTIVLMLLVSVTAGAQNIAPGSLWYDGGNCYSAIVERDGAIVMQAMNEGQELEFQLFPIEGQSNSYTVAQGGNEYADMPFPKGYTMKYRHQEGMKVLCVYNLDNKLETVMIWTPDDCRHNNVWTWIPQVKGIYTTEPGGYLVTVNDMTVMVEGREGSYEVQTFNDMVNGVVKVSDTWVKGYFQIVPTLEGFNVYQGSFDEYGLFERSEESPYGLVACDPDKGRFDFASTLLLTKAALARYKKSTLRIMRNSILAKHGYRFQSKDLQEYFGAQDWYMPQNNDDIKLSFVEQLNIEMIKTAEADPNHDEYVWEE